MTGFRVVGVHNDSLPHIVYKWKSVLEVDCLDYIVDFFISIDESIELLDFIRPCRKVYYRLDDRKILVFPQVPLLL